MRLIDANKLKPIQVYRGDVYCQMVFMADIENAPTVDAEPVRHGHWQQLWEDKDQIQARCSCCGMVFWIGKGRDGNYCPHCGAKMDEDSNTHNTDSMR